MSTSTSHPTHLASSSSMSTSPSTRPTRPNQNSKVTTGDVKRHRQLQLPFQKLPPPPPQGVQSRTVIHPAVPITRKDQIASPSSDPLTFSESEDKAPRRKVVQPRNTAPSITTMNSNVGEAGPSRPTRTNHHAQEKPSTSILPSTPVSDLKGKGKAVERRVLPARIRRAAGGGVEGMRDVEEMITDWLERWGEPQVTPPDDLPFHLTTIPLDFVDPPTSRKDTLQPAQIVTLTPTRRKVDREEREVTINGGAGGERIETPQWIMVTPGEDDRWEAKEELEIASFGKGKNASHSPVKRLRRGGIGDEPDEDTSDNYYNLLHKKYETFERRQRIREKEKLQFERYKMRSRIDLLRNLSKDAWAAVVSNVLCRGGDEWLKGKIKVEEKGGDWLRRILIKEGEEVMKRYEELLPPDQKRHKDKIAANSSHTESRLSTPGRTSSSPSLTPPPTVLPARVVALRDPSTSSTKRKRRSTTNATADGPTTQQDSPSQRAKSEKSRAATVTTPAKRQRSHTLTAELGEEYGDDVKMEYMPAQTSHLPLPVIQQSLPFTNGTLPKSSTAMAGTSTSISISPHNALSASVPTNPQPKPLTSQQSVHPEPVSTIPYLIEAASRRESALEEIESTKVRSEGPRFGRLISREKTRASRRLEVVNPFGMPLPGVVEKRSEFTLTEEEDFWPIIAEREERANKARRASLLHNSGTSIGTSCTSPMDPPLPEDKGSNGHPRADVKAQARGSGDGINGRSLTVSTMGAGVEIIDLSVSSDEIEEMEGVEATVVL